MLTTLAVLLRAGLELFLCLTLVAVYVSRGSNRQLVRSIRTGCGWGVIVSLVVYDLNKMVIRIELLDVIAKGLAVAFVLIFLLWTARAAKDGTRWGKPVIFLLCFALAFDKTSLIIAVFAPVAAMQNGFNSEWVLENTAIAIGAALLLLLSLGIKKIAGRANRRDMLWWQWAAFLLLFFGLVIEWLQLLFGLHILPLTMWVLDVLSPLVNHKQLLYDGQFVVFALFLAATIARTVKTAGAGMHDALNPAQRRKIAAGERRLRRWLVALSSIVIIMAGSEAGSLAQAAQQAEEKPAVQIRAENGRVVLQKAMLREKELNVFECEMDDHTHVRFLAVRKTGENFGVALDSCQICGEAGYFQKDGQIICQKCGSVVNVATIGFKGGCNPIPLQFTASMKDTLELSAAELQSAGAATR